MLGWIQIGVFDSYRVQSGRQYEIYSSFSMYLCRMSFHCFCGNACQPKCLYKYESNSYKRKPAYSFIPVVPEGIGSSIKADSEGKSSAHYGGEEHACAECQNPNPADIQCKDLHCYEPMGRKDVLLRRAKLL